MPNGMPWRMQQVETPTTEVIVSFEATNVQRSFLACRECDFDDCPITVNITGRLPPLSVCWLPWQILLPISQSHSDLQVL